MDAELLFRKRIACRKGIRGDMSGRYPNLYAGSVHESNIDLRWYRRAFACSATTTRSKGDHKHSGERETVYEFTAWTGCKLISGRTSKNGGKKMRTVTLGVSIQDSQTSLRRISRQPVASSSVATVELLWKVSPPRGGPFFSHGRPGEMTIVRSAR